MNQPQPQYQAPAARPNNYLVPAILTTLFCCLPLGIVSIVFAAQVDGKVASGDYAGAQAASANAKRWATIAAISGIVIGVLYVLAIVVLGASFGSFNFSASTTP